MEISEKRAYLDLLGKEGITESSFERRMEQIIKAKTFCCYLEEHGVHYDRCIKHRKVNGCDESSLYYQRFQEYLQDEYVICKNLLVRERKGERRKFLLVTDSRKQLDLKALKDTLGCSKLEFVQEEEMKSLIHTTPGNVSLFNMMYDKDKQVTLVFDQDLLQAKSLAFHPLYNEMSLFLQPKECLKFMKLIHRESDTEFVPMCEKMEKGYEKRIV